MCSLQLTGNYRPGILTVRLWTDLHWIKIIDLVCDHWNCRTSAGKTSLAWITLAPSTRGQAGVGADTRRERVVLKGSVWAGTLSAETRLAGESWRQQIVARRSLQRALCRGQTRLSAPQLSLGPSAKAIAPWTVTRSLTQPLTRAVTTVKTVSGDARQIRKTEFINIFHDHTLMNEAFPPSRALQEHLCCACL